MMKFSVRLKQDITIIDLTGPVTIGTGDVALREAVREALDGGARKILLNLKAVTKMDSSGIGELVSAYTTTANRGGRLKLLSLPPKIQEVLVVTQLITVFEIYDDEDEAVSSF